ncbi:hypothetical protein EPT53_05005 [Fusobacterium necrophorum]|uniref:FMN-binding protein n=1 Tax=Fusobacterium necrophorum TaxID=859 RepID=A0A4Q2L1C9_9FUSO|nr:hypothetical protein [Fusobacterium necrophorum]RXZ70052.1 hypothetical protein EPT53_05005 [Fusobacterium necrophorum]
MKKMIVLFSFLLATTAYASTYRDGIYRGYYISGQETQIEVQFTLKNDVMTEAKYRTLRYKDHDWLKEEEYVAKNKGYMGALNYMVGKKVNQAVLDKLYTPEGIETAGATVRGGKLRHAVQLALMTGPIKLTK